MTFSFVKFNFKVQWLEGYQAKHVERKDLTYSIVLLVDVCYLRLTGGAFEKDAKHS